MKTLGIALVLAALPFVAAAQDPVKVDPGHYKVLIDNPAVRVLKVNVPAGAKSPMHSHPDALLVPLDDRERPLHDAGRQDRGQPLTKETASFTPASTHAPANVGTTKVEAILVEFKTKAPGTAVVPTARPGTRADGPRREPARGRLQDRDRPRLPGARREHPRLRPGRDRPRARRASRSTWRAKRP